MADVLGGEQADAAAEIELLTSRMVLGRTVQELHLDTVVTPISSRWLAVVCLA